MNYWIIKKTDGRGGYLMPAGSARTWGRDGRKAQRFPSYEAALAECCPENEIPVLL